MTDPETERRPEWWEYADARNTPINPDCRDGKHDACNDDAWDAVRDAATDCTCTCHPPKETTE